jgi:hypothetical protein
VPLGCEHRAEFFLAGGFTGAHVAAAAGVFVAAKLVVGLGDDLGDLHAFAAVVHGDEGEVGGADVAQGLCVYVFDHGLHADLHGGVEGAVDAGLEDEDVADLDGSDEVEVVHGDGDGDGAGVAAGGHGADEVDELHEAAAEEVAEGVGIARKDDLGALGLARTDWPRCRIVAHPPILRVKPSFEKPSHLFRNRDACDVRRAKRKVRGGRHIRTYDRSMDKIAMLNEILAQKPGDAFARYGLAMAYAAEGRNEDALREYAETTAHSPDYVPAYQMSAQLLLKLDRAEEARVRIVNGLAACERTGNLHAASEMEAMLEELD